MVLCLAAVSCVYPYEPDFTGTSGSLVIDGDMLIGAESTFSLHFTKGIDEGYLEESYPVGRLWIESATGEIYEASHTGRGEYVLDSRSADPAGSYRLHFDEAYVGIASASYRRYASDWQTSPGVCVLDSLSYRIDPDGENIRFLMTFHSDDGCHWFRYHTREDWEYTAPMFTHYQYKGSDKDNPYGRIVGFEDGNNTYYCWNKDTSLGLNMISTADLSGDRYVDYPLVSMDKSSQKISYLYRLDVTLYSISEENYKYYRNIRDNSGNGGDLFAPIPSELRGNIRNLDDESELVLGYFGISSVATGRIYEQDSEVNFHRMKHELFEKRQIAQFDWPHMHMRGYRPCSFDYMVNDYLWVEQRCVDCTSWGGNKNKPADWPTPEK